MKLLQRLRRIAESRINDISNGSAGSISKAKLDIYQTDENISPIPPVFVWEDLDLVTNGGRRHIPEIHEDLPPTGVRIQDDDSGLGPA